MASYFIAKSYYLLKIPIIERDTPLKANARKVKEVANLDPYQISLYDIVLLLITIILE